MAELLPFTSGLFTCSEETVDFSWEEETVPGPIPSIAELQQSDSVGKNSFLAVSLAPVQGS